MAGILILMADDWKPTTNSGLNLVKRSCSERIGLLQADDVMMNGMSIETTSRVVMAIGRAEVSAGAG